MSNELKEPGLDRDDNRQAERAAADLRDQMTRLKARYRVERRLLETRSFDEKRG